jgi:hypothetical protein
MKKLRFQITHDGREWVVTDQTVSISSPTLEGLDIRVREYLRKRGKLKHGERLKVLMEFDNYSIPQWIRQYSQHYFDRVVELEG